MAPDLHSPTFYANAPDLSLFLFDSWNYYMDCIRMDANHILCVKEKLSTTSHRSRGENYFCLFYFYCYVMRACLLFRCAGFCCVEKTMNRTKTTAYATTNSKTGFHIMFEVPLVLVIYYMEQTLLEQDLKWNKIKHLQAE